MALIRQILQAIGQDESVPDQRCESSHFTLNATAIPRILVAEDECIIALDLISTLERLGYFVTGHAISSEEAVEEAIRTQPNLVLMDIRLKDGSDGIEAAEQIHAQLGIPVVFVSAFSDDNTLQRVKAARMAGFLRKPFSRHQLKEVIKGALGRSANE
ncbi:MAG: response regulator [Chloroflexi bacterium]|nr:response regulator [Chloroflexota bacterium]